MKVGKWYREESTNPENGKQEWKYYYVTSEVQENFLGIDVYKVHWNGKISGKHSSECHASTLDRLTLVKKEYALKVLGIKDPEDK